MLRFVAESSGIAVAFALCLGLSRTLPAATFATPLQTGSIQNSSVNEASGLIASRLNPNVLWTHNDSGDSARVFPMSTAGANLGTYAISGASATDWEDIAVGPGPTAGQQYLYIADTGDNGASRSSVSIYRVPEPVVSDTQSPVTTTLTGAQKLTFKYPDGARDAESMFVDPGTGDIYIISKRENPHHVYRAAYPQSTSGTTTLELVTTFSTTSDWLTSADISPTGNEILVRDTESNSGRLYTRPVGGTIASAFATTPMTIPLATEQQGEAITFDPSGHGYYTTSEGNNQPVYYVDRLAPPAGAMYWDADGVAAGSRSATGAGTGGSGTWDSSARRWYNGSAELAWSGGDDAIFWGAAGTVTLAAQQTVNNVTFKTNGYTLTGSSLVMGGQFVVVDENVNATIGSEISGVSGLIKRGNGNLTLTQANGYVGNTIVGEGSLHIASPQGSATGFGSVTVLAGARLDGAGAIYGSVNNSGVVAPTRGGQFEVGGLFSQSSTGRLEVELASATDYGRLDVRSSAEVGGTLAVSLAAGFMPAVGAVFHVVAADAIVHQFSHVELPPLPEHLQWKVDNSPQAVTLSVVLSGDFNSDGFVDAADYLVWRESFAIKYNENDYNDWRANFGVTMANIAGAATQSAAIPEPLPLGLLLVTALTLPARQPLWARNRTTRQCPPAARCG